MTEATPTPWWTLRADPSRDFNIWAQVRGERCIIGKMFWSVGPYGFDLAEANATRLITAVQSHDALVRAVEQSAAAINLARGERS